MITKTISSREKEVLDLISLGFTDREIGLQLKISQYTANDHRKNLISKFGCKNACAMVRLALELELIPMVKAA